MRRLEILLIGVVLAVSLLTMAGTGGPLAALVVAVSLVAHLGIDHYRWQMSPVYFAAVLSIAATLIALEASTWVGLVLLGLALLALAVGTVTSLGLPIYQPPKLGGPHSVGTTTRYLSHQTRSEIHSADKSDRRQLTLQIWYPAKETDRPTVGYLPDAKRGGPALARAAEMPTFGLNHLGLIRSNSRQEAPVAEQDRPYKVLLFSHGRSGTRVQNTYQVEELVSHGYLVAAVDHPYGAGYTIDAEGRLIDYDHGIFGDDSPSQAGTVINEWVQDLEWVLDYLETINTDSKDLLAGSLDLTRVGCFGHSAGAGAVIELSFRDERCGPVVAYDPWVVPLSDETLANGLSSPLLILKQPNELGPINRDRIRHLVKEGAGSTQVRQIDGTKHIDYNDYKLLVPALRLIGMTGSIGGERLRRILNHYTLTFFDHHLRASGSNFEPDQANYPEVSAPSET